MPAAVLAAQAASKAPPRLSTRAKLIILTAVMASLLEIIDTSIVNVAIPTMMGNLGATLDEISWVVTGYIIANAIVLPIASWISQQVGRKLYYTSCILLFTAASVACGMAPNLAHARRLPRACRVSPAARFFPLRRR